MTGPVLVDAGPLVALLSKSQAPHERCKRLFDQLASPLLTCWPVLTEAAYLLRRHPKQVRELLDAADGGFLELLPLAATDISGITTILDRYADQGFQLADAALMHLAERERISHVFTLDLRDFGIFRTSSGIRLSIIGE